MEIDVIITPDAEESLKDIKNFILTKFSQKEYDKLLT